MNKDTLAKYKHIFFIGIGGISMSGLSEVLNSSGKRVEGSDQSSSDITKHLETLGIKVYIGHLKEHITPDIDLVVYTAAIKKENEEYQQALQLGIETMDRGTLLGHIMDRYETSIGVSGTHGKTTTTSMLSYIMLEGSLDPTISVGGILKGINGNFKIGTSDFFITEACEYSNSYHHFFPNINIVLNIEEDHLDFFKDIHEIRDSFKKYMHNTKPGGTLILNDSIDDISTLTDGLNCNIITVGSKLTSDFSYTEASFNEKGFATFTLLEKGVPQTRLHLNVTGLHNIENALASIAASKIMGLDMDTIQRGLLNFGGADRRFEYKGIKNGITIIDDYAHHPTEIRKTIEAAKNIPHHNLWIVFQPHTYTRTKALFSDFIDALYEADKIIITDIYAAREKDPGDIHSKMLVESLSKLGKDIVYIAEFEEICKYLLHQCIPNDMLITMGAGSVTNIGPLLISM